MIVDGTVYIAFIVVVIYLIYSFFIKIHPDMKNLCKVIIPACTIYTCIYLYYDLFFGDKSLGDYEDYKLYLFLGNTAIIWLSTENLISVLKKQK